MTPAKGGILRNVMRSLASFFDECKIITASCVMEIASPLTQTFSTTPLRFSRRFESFFRLMRNGKEELYTTFHEILAICLLYCVDHGILPAELVHFGGSSMSICGRVHSVVDTILGKVEFADFAPIKRTEMDQSTGGLL